jgi:tetratricopeptide (TPR) repeat protein
VPTEEQLREIHRLALRGGEVAIAQDVTHRLAGPWLGVSRFREVRDLCRQTLQLGSAPATLTYLARATRVLGDVQEALRLYREALQMYDGSGDRAGLAATLSNIGTVYDNLGQRAQALAYYEKALPIREEVGDRAGLATTLSNIGLVYDNLGQRAQALVYYEKALPIWEEVGGRAGERVTRYNMAMLYRAQGQLRKAVEALQTVVALDEQIHSPDLEANRAVLTQVEAALDSNEAIEGLAQFRRQGELG